MERRRGEQEEKEYYNKAVGSITSHFLAGGANKTTEGLFEGC